MHVESSKRYIFLTYTSDFQPQVSFAQLKFCLHSEQEIYQIRIPAHEPECTRWDKSVVYSVCDPGAGAPRPCPITTERCVLGSSGREIEK